MKIEYTNIFFRRLYSRLEKKIQDRIDSHFTIYQKKINLPLSFEAVPTYLDRNTTIDQAYHSSDDAKEIFQSYQLHACDHCSVRFDETLEEASQAYRIPLEIWQIQLNCKIFNRFS